VLLLVCPAYSSLQHPMLLVWGGVTRRLILSAHQRHSSAPLISAIMGGCHAQTNTLRPSTPLISTTHQRHMEPPQ
jgi:hypothetical protein